ncbi:MAG: non-ribosomal peptide synthetase, partial [Planctomycetes bacterium]|nr:non-ribosomal peptide synthetase [Planctomycetota bacterium]
PDGNPRLVAYLAPLVGVDRLRAHARRRLPDYMVPQAIVELSALPRLPNGKVDRKRLPRPRFESAHVRHVPARTPIEAILVSLWEDVLDHSPIGIHDDFFELGGHSLLATQLISRIRDALSIELPLRTLFEHRTISAIATNLDSNLHHDPTVVSPIQPMASDEPRRASSVQRRLWFLDQLEGTHNYHMALAIHLPPGLDADVVVEAVAWLWR